MRPSSHENSSSPGAQIPTSPHSLSNPDPAVLSGLPLRPSLPDTAVPGCPEARRGKWNYSLPLDLGLLRNPRILSFILLCAPGLYQHLESPFLMSIISPFISNCQGCSGLSINILTVSTCHELSGPRVSLTYGNRHWSSYVCPKNTVFFEPVTEPSRSVPPPTSNFLPFC